MDGVAERLQLEAGASHPKLTKMAKDLGIDLVICGPEAPLAANLAKAMVEAGLPFFGPSAYLAQLESSKHFGKKFMAEAGIPTANYQVVESKVRCLEVARSFLERLGGVVLKADGLAGGKGVFVCESQVQVEEAIDQLYQERLSAATKVVVVEEVLIGRECSFFVMLGQSDPHPLGFAVDFKRLHEGDKGPNTGGMGCYTPVPWLPDNASNTVMEAVVSPLIALLNKTGHRYVGWLYVGLMWTTEGPKVVEFNVRLGDPEAQVLAGSDDDDWLELISHQLGLLTPNPLTCLDTTSGDWHRRNLQDSPSENENLLGNRAGSSSSTNFTLGVVMASAGYPYGKPAEENFTSKALPKITFPQKNSANSGSVLADQSSGATVFAAAVTEGGTSETVQTGIGRVLTVTAKGQSFESARQIAYEKVRSLAEGWPGCQYRGDIGERLT